MAITLIESVKSRTNGRWGIGRAVNYLKAFSGCWGDGFCPTDMIGHSDEEWADAIKSAESQLVYAAKDMEVTGFDEGDIPEDACLVFEAVLTSTRKDRDGDVLETKGADIDPKMPLLWQHNKLQPLGKFMGVTGRSDSLLKGRSAVIDTPFGRDAAKFIKFGSLRISHGFNPSEFEPLDEKGNGDGWRIKVWEMMEKSVVSVPSNVDAMILGVNEKDMEKSFAKELDGIRTVFGRGALETDVMKQWAGAYYDSRPVQGKGLLFPESADAPAKSVGSDTKERIGVAASIEAGAAKAVCGCKAAKDADEKMEGTCPKCGYCGEMKPKDDEERGISLELKQQVVDSLTDDELRAELKLREVIEKHTKPSVLSRFRKHTGELVEAGQPVS